jgi:hypothetical protein
LLQDPAHVLFGPAHLYVLPELPKALVPMKLCVRQPASLWALELYPDEGAARQHGDPVRHALHQIGYKFQADATRLPDTPDKSRLDVAL